MKKAILGFVAAAGLASSGAFADNKVGVHFGYPGVGAQYQIDNVFGVGNGLRLSATVPFFYTFSALQLDVDAMLGHISLGSNALSLYYGAGAHGGFFFAGAGGFYVGAHGLVGLEYAFTPTISAYVDTRLGFSFGSTVVGGVSAFGADYGGQFGVNFKL